MKTITLTILLFTLICSSYQSPKITKKELIKNFGRGANVITDPLHRAWYANRALQQLETECTYPGKDCNYINALKIVEIGKVEADIVITQWDTKSIAFTVTFKLAGTDCEREGSIKTRHLCKELSDKTTLPNRWGIASGRQECTVEVWWNGSEARVYEFTWPGLTGIQKHECHAINESANDDPNEKERLRILGQNLLNAEVNYGPKPKKFNYYNSRINYS